MTDALSLPQVPEPKPEDPEDVSWALSTAEAMWARGDHSEGIKWVRRAAEAASEAENDSRALELAKVAADLTGLVERARASIDIEVDPASDPVLRIPAPPPVPTTRPAKPPVPKPATNASVAPKNNPGSVTKQVVTPSRPPAPFPSRTSKPPPGPTASQPPAAFASQPPPSGKGKPLGTNTGKPPSLRPGALKADANTTTTATTAKPRDAPTSSVKKARRSRDNIDPKAVDALSSDTAEVPARFDPPRRDANADATMVGSVDDIKRAAARSAAEWDTDLTQNLTGDDFQDGDRKTVAFQVGPRASVSPPSSGSAAPVSGTNPPATVVASRVPTGAAAASNVAAGRVPSLDGKRGSVAPSDPGIQTSQAVRVIVWRDASGVHVAPAGTVVSAITVDAVLVALEPNADLTAWLTRKGR